MADGPVQDGTVPYRIPSLETACSTYYKIIGDLQSKPPLIVIHGGPGGGHEYLLTFAQLWRRYKIPVIFYDQVGCASSTHLREKAGDKDLWTVELFVQELENLLDFFHLRDGLGFDILGHSWGGVLGAYFASRRPRGLRRLIIAGSPAQPDEFPNCLNNCWKQLSQDDQEALEEALQTGDFTSQRYQDSYTNVLRTFWCRADPFPPKELQPTIDHCTNDPTVGTTMFGENDHFCTGTLQGWRLIPVLSQIKVPSLVYRGEFDFVTEEAVMPFVRNIPDVRQVTIANASHMAHVDNEETQEKVLELVGTFLSEDRVS